MNTSKNKDFVFEEDDYLWKYLDLHKFFYFIIHKNLVFTRLDRFEDPLEGLPDKILSILSILEIEPNSKKELNDSFTDEQKDDFLIKRRYDEKYANEQIDLYQKMQFANCWFLSRKESFAMWNNYSNKDSVAIRYKPNDLLKIVLPSANSYVHADFQEFVYGLVDYDDIWPYNHYKKSRKDIIYTAFKKDNSYEHENEFRFLVATNTECINKYDSFELPLGDITKDDFWIFTNPYMDQWKFNNLKQMLKDYSMDKKLYKSKLKIKK